jgi:hypothetical protein
VSAAGDGDSGQAPHEELARESAEAYAEFTAYAEDPGVPERARHIARRLASLFADQAAAVARNDLRMAEVQRRDMTALAAILKGRLTREQAADLIVRLDSPQ